MTTTFSQSAYGDLPYEVDWTAWLSGDTIASATVTATAPLVASSVTHTNTTVSVWLDSTACAVGDVLPVRCEIETATGMIESRTFRITIVE